MDAKELIACINEFIRIGNTSISVSDVKKIFGEFLRCNICLPKDCQKQAFYNGAWNDIVNIRIKPSSPIYEWKWYYITLLGEINISSFATEDEARTQLPQGSKKFEETKRERK